jgi:hypothetical protein
MPCQTTQQNFTFHDVVAAILNWTIQNDCQGNFEDGNFQEVIVHDTNNIGQYRLGLQIGSLDRNHLCKMEETWYQNQELSTE